MMLGIRGIMDKKIFIDKPSIDEQWDEDPKTYDELIKKESDLDESLNRCFEQRTELFEKMKVSELDEQRHLVDLIQNVVWGRELHLSKVKTQLEISFTPRLQRMLKNEKDK